MTDKQIQQLSNALVEVFMSNKELVVEILRDAAKNGGQINFREE